MQYGLSAIADLLVLAVIRSLQQTAAHCCETLAKLMSLPLFVCNTSFLESQSSCGIEWLELLSTPNGG